MTEISVEGFVKIWRHHNFNADANTIKRRLLQFKRIAIVEMCRAEGFLVDYDTVVTILANGALSNYTGNVDLVILINNLSKAFDFVVECGVNQIPLTPYLINTIWRITSNGLTTQQYENVCTKHLFDSKVVFQQINRIVSDVRKHYNAEVIVKPLAYLMTEFLQLLPFEKYNEAVIRLLLDYYLLFNKCPPILIFNVDKEILYLSIVETRERGNLIYAFEQLSEIYKETWNMFFNDSIVLGNNIEDYQFETEEDDYA